LRAADQIPSANWTERARPEQWSAAEIVAHLICVERAILTNADHIVQKSPRHIPLWKRAHLPMWLAAVRLIRLKSPAALEPTATGNKEELLGELRETRERAFAFLGETEKRDLRVYCWKHPFMGRLNFYEWFELIAAHQIRHTKQMQDLGKRLPKVVESSQIQ
jgi:DinB family protein